MSVTTYHPASLVETAPLLLPPLAEALTEEQHKQQLDEQQRQVSSKQNSTMQCEGCVCLLQLLLQSVNSTSSCTVVTCIQTLLPQAAVADSLPLIALHLSHAAGGAAAG
jgi:hypothetical protein